jgi:solute:Na+ symporter, SSS family
MTPLLATGLQPFDYVVVFAYMAGLIGVGIFIAWRQKTAEQFFVGDRHMPWFLVGVSMLATLTSTLTYLGVPGDLIKNGLAMGLGQLMAPFSFVVVGFVWLPFYMRLRLTSAYEYLELRFGPATRALGVTLYLYMRFIWVGAILYTVSLAVSEMTKDSGPDAIAALTGGAITFGDRGWFYFVLISTGVVSTTYTALGGIKGLIWIDFIHFVVLMTGAVVTLVVIASRTGTGPADWWHETTTLSHKFPALASWDLSVPRTVLWVLLATFFWDICTHSSDQVALQLYFTTRSAADARRTALVSYVLNASMTALLVLVGMALLTYYVHSVHELPAGVADPRSAAFADKIFPHFIAQSSVDSGINSSATVLTVDVILRWRGPMSQEAQLKLVRWLTVVLGAIVTVAAIGISLTAGKFNIIDMQMRSFNCVLGPLGAIFMSGILLPHVGGRAAFTAGILGAAAGAFLGYGGLLPGIASPSSLLVIPLSWLATFTLAAVLGGVMPPPRPEQLSGLTWQSVMRGDCSTEPRADGPAKPEDA